MDLSPPALTTTCDDISLPRASSCCFLDLAPAAVLPPGTSQGLSRPQSTFTSLPRTSSGYSLVSAPLPRDGSGLFGTSGFPRVDSGTWGISVPAPSGLTTSMSGNALYLMEEGSGGLPSGRGRQDSVDDMERVMLQNAELNKSDKVWQNMIQKREPDVMEECKSPDTKVPEPAPAAAVAPLVQGGQPEPSANFPITMQDQPSVPDASMYTSSPSSRSISASISTAEEDPAGRRRVPGNPKVEVAVKKKIRRRRLTKEEEAKYDPAQLVDLTGTTAAKSRKMTPEQRDVMLHKRRLRNRASAARSREKQRKTIGELLDEFELLENRTSKLVKEFRRVTQESKRTKERYAALKKEVETYKEWRKWKTQRAALSKAPAPSAAGSGSGANANDTPRSQQPSGTFHLDPSRISSAFDTPLSGEKYCLDYAGLRTNESYETYF